MVDRIVVSEKKKDPLHIGMVEAKAAFSPRIVDLEVSIGIHNKAVDRVRSEGDYAVLDIRESLRVQASQFSMEPNAKNWKLLEGAMLAYQAATEAKRRIENGTAGEVRCG